MNARNQVGMNVVKVLLFIASIMMCCALLSSCKKEDVAPAISNHKINLIIEASDISICRWGVDPGDVGYVSNYTEIKPSGVTSVAIDTTFTMTSEESLTVLIELNENLETKYISHIAIYDNGIKMKDFSGFKKGNLLYEYK